MKSVIDEIEQVLLKYGYQDLFGDLEDYVTELVSDNKSDTTWLTREKEDLEDEIEELNNSFKSLKEELEAAQKKLEIFGPYEDSINLLLLNHNYISPKELEEFVESKAVIIC